jgi:CubicO group peptidase (beta-lactamase class C family)
MKKPILFVFMVFVLTACLTEDPPFLAFSNIQATDINDGWEISSPAMENIDEPALSKVYKDIQNEGDLWQIRSLLVFRNGKLVAESYLKDKNDQTTPRPLWSCTKQILGVLTGIALEQSYLAAINDPLSKYLPEVLTDHSDKKDITLRNLLTMRSGIGFDEAADFSILLQKEEGNTIDFILGQPMIFNPGQQFYYHSGNSHLIAAAMQNAVNKPLEEWADEVLFSKIGFNNYTWLTSDGYNVGGYGISTTPRELAKVAQLVLNDGAWAGQQVVPEQWISAMRTTQSDIGVSSDHSFGYHWWINAKEGLYYMAGSGGQYAFIIPDKNMLVVAMSEYDTDGDLEIDADTMLDIVKKIRVTAN